MLCPYMIISNCETKSGIFIAQANHFANLFPIIRISRRERNISRRDKMCIRDRVCRYLAKQKNSNHEPDAHYDMDPVPKAKLLHL